MAIELQQCKDMLANQLVKDFSQQYNVSPLTTSAWGKDKAECFSNFGGTTKIKEYIYQIKKDYESGKLVVKQDIVSNDGYEDPGDIQTTIQKPEDPAGMFGYSWNQIGNYVMTGFLVLIFFYLFLKVLKYGLRYLYSFLNKNRFVYMKVNLPKGDDKLGREQAKELAKDMKEKIGRMSQVYMNFHKITELSTFDKFMYKIFSKQKIVMIYHYEDGILSFIVGVFPEYQKIVEGAISSQFSDCSIESIPKPRYFARKHSDITVIEPKKDPIYTIKMYKLMPDDPINNLIDAMSKVSNYDTVSILMPIKPEGSWFNDKMKKAADRLYKNLDINTTPWRHYIFMPWKIFGFLIMGPSKKLLSGGKDEADGVTMVRMVKAKEDAMNAIGEEAGLPVFRSSIILITSSDTKDNLQGNIDSLVSAYNIYADEYSNELNEANTKHDAFGFIFKPLWTIATKFYLTGFFFKYGYFSVNQLTSLFHFPDGIYNRSPIIEWMQYKVLPAPSNLPIMPKEEETGFVMGGILAEKYKKGILSDILASGYKSHWAVSEKIFQEEYLESVEKFPQKELEGKDIVEKKGKKYVKLFREKKGYGYKMFKNGVLLGINIYRNNLSPVYMKREDRTRHYYCIGKSGTGKSVFLQTLARQDVWNGDGICLVDPHGDLAEDILAYVPKERAKDVVYFDAGNEDRPMGLNLYEISNLDEADRVVNDATEIFIKMFGPEIFGPRIQEYFKYGSLTLLEDFDDRPTLLDVVRLFTDEGYREYKTKKVTNPVVKNRREKTFNAMGDREKQEIIPYFSAKFVSFNTNRLIRNIIGQTKSAFKFEDIMDNRKILIINLSKGKIGEMNAQLLGMIIVSKIYTAAMGRAKMDEKDRKDFYLYVDEFQNFVSGTFADILSEARKYRLCLIMAHQYIAQLDPPKGLGGDGGGKGDVKAAVFGNVGTMQSFKVGAPDAEFLEKEYVPILSGQDIVGIANYKAYIKLNIDNATTRVFSMNMLYSKDYQSKKIVPILKEYCGKKYGRKREFVDAEINARLGLGVDEEVLPQDSSENQDNPVKQDSSTNQDDSK
ncbi:hypothetical protein K9M48_02780 [Candidatus Gracilibacteria bacterium]|nr:hypothetical protein [Candidatus Gracilibacteria bacterium]